MAFEGFTRDTFAFFLELAFNNNAAFFEANRERYKQSVHQPFVELSQALSPVLREIDEQFVLAPARTLSRIRRDTRFSRDKSPYRDHLWLKFLREDEYKDNVFAFYFSLHPDEYSYGMGMYDMNKPFMDAFCARVLAFPSGLLDALNAADGFELFGEDYKRLPRPDAPPEIRKWVNMRYFSLQRNDSDVTKTMSAGLVDEISEGFKRLKPLYQFIRSQS